MPLLLPCFHLVRPGFWCVVRLFAVLAVSALAVNLNAQEYEVDGNIELKLFRHDRSPWKDYQGSFRVYVNGCAWLIQVTETNDAGVLQRREVGTKDGKEVLEMVLPDEPISPSDAPLAGLKAGMMLPTGFLSSNAIPVGNLDNSLTGHLWLMFASGCYFRTAPPGRLTPVFDWRATPAMNNRFTMKASWDLINGTLPSRVVYFESDGAPSAVYMATGFTNVGSLTLPAGFDFTQPRTGYKQVSATVTAVRPTCSRADLRPTPKQTMVMTDFRWHPTASALITQPIRPAIGPR